MSSRGVQQSQVVCVCVCVCVQDVKVPVCPLCSQPVPVAKGEDPNARVDDHIQRDCKSDKAKKVRGSRKPR